MKTKIFKYRVDGQSEEFICPACSDLVVDGSSAYLVECNARESVLVFCSRSCNSQDLKNSQK